MAKIETTHDAFDGNIFELVEQNHVYVRSTSEGGMVLHIEGTGGFKTKITLPQNQLRQMYTQMQSIEKKKADARYEASLKEGESVVSEDGI